MANRVPFMMPSQAGTSSPAVAAGSPPISAMIPGQSVGGRTPPRPPMPMGGSPNRQGGVPGAPQVEPRLPIQPYAGGPTSPMNISPMLQTGQQGQGQPSPPPLPPAQPSPTSLPAWGDQGTPPGGGMPQAPGAPAAPVTGLPPGGAGGAPFGPSRMLQLMKSMGRI